MFRGSAIYKGKQLSALEALVQINGFLEQLAKNHSGFSSRYIAMKTQRHEEIPEFLERPPCLRAFVAIKYKSKDIRSKI